MELTKKQKIIAAVVFFSLLAAVGIGGNIIKARKLEKAHTYPTAEEMQSLERITEFALDELKAWADEKGYYASGVPGSPAVPAVSQNAGKAIGIYKEKETKEANKYDTIFNVSFRARGGMTVGLSRKTNDLEGALEEIRGLLGQIAEVNNLFDKTKISQAQLQEFLDESADNMQEQLRETGNYDKTSGEEGGAELQICDYNVLPGGTDREYRYQIYFRFSGEYDLK
ncbi:MAG: hypothetical protein ACI4LL_00665 [Anaerovoracaceae bacterium]